MSDNEDASKIYPTRNDGAKPPTSFADDFTAEAKQALDELVAHDENHLPVMLRFGEALAKAKAHFKHGAYRRWCEDTLKRSPSWCSTYRRLFEGRVDLQPALTWAKDSDHKWANCRSVEKLLALIAEWRKMSRGDSPSAPRTRRKAADIIAELRQRLAEADADIKALRDPLPQAVEGRVAELATAARADNIAASEELTSIARRFHWRLRDLFDLEICSALQVSTPPKEDSAVTHPGMLKSEQLGPVEDTTRKPGRLHDSFSPNSLPEASSGTIGASGRDEQRRPSAGRTDEGNSASGQTSPLARLRGLVGKSGQPEKPNGTSRNTGPSRQAIMGGANEF